MINPSIDEILDPHRRLDIESKFELITLVARRSRQINDQAEILVKTDETKPVTIALEEIYQGMVIPVRKKEKPEE